MDDVRATLNDLEVRELPFPTEAGAKLALLRASTKLKMPDCCVLLAAEDVGARLATFDARVNRVASTRNIVVLDG